MNLAEALAHHARARPDQPAIVHGGRTILYRDLDARVAALAAWLAAQGVAPGDVVGLALRDTPEHLLALYASARLGAVSLPLDHRWTAAEQHAVATRFRARLVLIEPDGPALPGLACVAMAEPSLGGTVTMAPGGEAPLLLSLSSGTTGRPKGPVVTQGQFLRRFWTHWIDLGLNANDRFISATPLYFGGGRTFCMSLLFAGGTVCLFPPPHAPAALVAEAVLRDATSLFLVPTQLRRLLELPAADTAPLRRLRLLLSSGAPLTPAERVAVRDRLCPGFHEYYASTEGGGVSLLRPGDLDAHPDSVGRPVFGVQVAVLDEAGHPVPPGAVGRLAYRGPGVATGFFDDAEADHAAFHAGWFLPGDLAEQDTDGFLTLRGRSRDLIIRGGVNIHPMEIEAVLLADPSVADAAVVGWPSRDLGEEVAAFVVARGTADADALRAACASRLAPYKVPKQVFLVADLPRNSAGKVLKAELVGRLAAI